MPGWKNLAVARRANYWKGWQNQKSRFVGTSSSGIPIYIGMHSVQGVQNTLFRNAFLYNGALQSSSPARDVDFTEKLIKQGQVDHAKLDCMGDMSYARMVRADFKVVVAQFCAAHVLKTFRKHIKFVNLLISIQPRHNSLQPKG
jgi:hypothetical protein